MKGNEARVVFFLHPVDQVNDGKAAKGEPLKNSLGIISLLLLALLLGLGVLVFLFFTLEVNPSQPKPVSTTEAYSESSTRGKTTMAHSESKSNETATDRTTEATSREKGDDETTRESWQGKIV